jgi:CheY-like chemotaxis protein
MMVVEDDPDLREAVVAALRARGYEVFEAADGAVALRMLDAIRPDAILLDLLMPTMDGFEFLAARAERPELAGIPVVIASAAPPERELAPSTWNELVVKPYDIATLVETLDRVCNPDRPRRS